jgi:NADH-quinone oxidoreductase subunit I
MFGTGLLKGLGVTFKHFVNSYKDDLGKVPSRYEGSVDLGTNRRIINQPLDQEGLFTIQYPEEKRLLPEAFRYIPMLIWDTERGEDRCTACGICAKVCPPQCIWIVRDSDEKGKPVTRPAEFYIDAAVCMSCSFCVEFCPFDAIKMNHDFELAVYERYPQLVYDMAELTVPVEYYAALWPRQYAQEEEKRRKDEEEKAAQEAAKAKAAEAKAAQAAQAQKEPAATTQRSPEEMEEMKRKAQERAAAAKAKAAAKATGAAAEPAAEPVVEPTAEPAIGQVANSGADDEAAQKAARLEELKRKAQERAKQRKETAAE